MRVLLAIAALSCALPAQAVSARAPVVEDEAFEDEEDEVDLPPCGTRDRVTCSVALVPVLSFVLPGLGEVADGRTAGPYIASALLGLGGAARETVAFAVAHPGATGDFGSGEDGIFNQQRLLLFLEAYQTAGFLSAYDTYRHRMVEQLGLRTHASTVGDVLAAPVHFAYAAKPSVFLPLLVGLGLAGLQAARPDPRVGRLFEGYRPTDALFTGAISYAAGTGEEAFFRGFLQSLLEHRYELHPFLANAVQGTLFGLAHGAVDVRILMGLYFGWLAQSNDYDLGPGVFLHAWWDVVAFTSAFALAGPGRRTGWVSLPSFVF